MVNWVQRKVAGLLAMQGAKRNDSASFCNTSFWYVSILSYVYSTKTGVTKHTFKMSTLVSKNKQSKAYTSAVNVAKQCKLVTGDYKDVIRLGVKDSKVTYLTIETTGGIEDIYNSRFSCLYDAMNETDRLYTFNK